jgi:hypothetical protein
MNYLTLRGSSALFNPATYFELVSAMEKPEN